MYSRRKNSVAKLKQVQASETSSRTEVSPQNHIQPDIDMSFTTPKGTRK